MDEPETNELFIDNFFKFFTELKEINENGEKFDIDWIYLKKKEDDLILYYFEKLGYNYDMIRPTIISKELKYTKPDNTDIITTIQTYNDSFINNVEKYYPNIGKALNKNDIKEILQIFIAKNDLFELLSEKIIYIIDKYKENPSLIYDNIILILDDFNCNLYIENIKAYYIAVKIIYINNKNFYFSNNFQYLTIFAYIILFYCITTTNITKRVFGTMTHDIIPGKREIDEKGQEQPEYTYRGILIDNITNYIMKIVTLNKYNFATENDYIISKIIGTDIKNLYSPPKDSLSQSEQLLNALTKYIKNLTSFDKPIKPTGGKRKTIKKRRLLKNYKFKKTFKNKKMKGGVLVLPELMSAYYYIGTYGPALSGVLTGYGSDRAKLSLVKILLDEISKNEPLLNSAIFRKNFNINNPLNKNCDLIPVSIDNLGLRAADKQAKQKCNEDKIDFNKNLTNEFASPDKYKSLIDLDKYFKENEINYKNCDNIYILKDLLQQDIENEKNLKETITFFVNILNVYSNLYISKCTNITKFDYNIYDEDEYNNAFESIRICFGNNQTAKNKPNFDKLDQLPLELKFKIKKKLVDILREEKTKYWNTNSKQIICPESRKRAYLSGFINAKFQELFKEFSIYKS